MCCDCEVLEEEVEESVEEEEVYGWGAVRGSRSVPAATVVTDLKLWDCTCVCM